ncbi:YdiU family protein [Pseudomonas sp. C27(2019)]|uniref:protein adenylyltransferase SelO n=1 Tax=Pseudomonas sp. C27(2019) TaxID=2604941 RepID=UPI0012461581|nr:YdiU family protein [Pseudomonas sp. C27(2019)]QEY59975.1 YdiU family protein [Pseudomonas sp. C27(2019)]
MRSLDTLEFAPRFAALGDAFSAPIKPTATEQAKMVICSPAALALLDLPASTADDPRLLQLAAGQWYWPDATPRAMVYSGHQFGGYTPQLGDGRGLLLAEVRNTAGEHWDVHLKGAGLTPFSRTGDGRAVLRSSIREFLASEYLHTLGIPTSRALCVTDSKTMVWREQRETAATLIRLAPSHIRFGHFEYFYYNKQYAKLEQLHAHVLNDLYPECLTADEPLAAMLGEVVKRTAETIALWQAYGFCHGVMNTDNMSILGLTFDFGPFAFLDDFKRAHVCNHSDHHARYAFNKQVEIGYWNLTAFAETLTRNVPVERLQEILDGYAGIQQHAYLQAMRARLGLLDEQESDALLIDKLLLQLNDSAVDYTLFFRRLGELPAAQALASMRDDFINQAAFAEWSSEFIARNANDSRTQEQRRTQMHAVNPLYMLRNYLIQIAIEAAEDGDYAPLHKLQQVLSEPFTEQEGYAAYAERPPEWGKHLSISCSS